MASCFVLLRAAGLLARAPSRRSRHPSAVAAPWVRGRLEALGLLVLLGYHLQPINVVFFNEPYGVDPQSCLVSRRASHLDAFSGYLFRT